MATTKKTVRTNITAAQVAAAQGGTDGDQRLVTVECPAHYDVEQITAADIVGDPAIRVVSPDADGYEADMPAAREWAASASAGDYLVEYEDTGMTAEQDPGSRCGYDDQQLDEIRRILAGRDLTLEADDRGLVAAAK